MHGTGRSPRGSQDRAAAAVAESRSSTADTPASGRPSRSPGHVPLQQGTGPGDAQRKSGVPQLLCINKLILSKSGNADRYCVRFEVEQWADGAGRGAEPKDTEPALGVDSKKYPGQREFEFKKAWKLNPGARRLKVSAMRCSEGPGSQGQGQQQKRVVVGWHIVDVLGRGDFYRKEHRHELTSASGVVPGAFINLKVDDREDASSLSSASSNPTSSTEVRQPSSGLQQGSRSRTVSQEELPGKRASGSGSSAEPHRSSIARTFTPVAEEGESQYNQEDEEEEESEEEESEEDDDEDLEGEESEEETVGEEAESEAEEEDEEVSQTPQTVAGRNLRRSTPLAL